MNMWQKIMVIYDYALNEGIINHPLKLLKINRIGILCHYLGTHQVDDIPMRILLA